MTVKNKRVIGGPVEFGGVTLPLSMAVRAGDLVFVSGMVAVDENNIPNLGGDVGQQTRLSLQAIERQLAKADCRMADVVKTMVFLKNKEDFPAFNAVYGEFFPEAPPARSSVCTDFVADAVLVEIEVVAYRPE